MKKRIFPMLAIFAVLVTCGSPAHAQLGMLGVGNSHPAGGTNNLAYVQTCETIYSTSANPVTINIGASGSCANGGTAANPHAGNLVHVFIGFNSDILSITTHTDTLGNTWSCTYDTGTAIADCSSTLTTGGSADTVSIGTTGTQTSSVVSLEMSGTNASPADGSDQFGSTGAGTSWTCPSVTTTNPNDVVLCFAVDRTADIGFTAGSGYTIPFGNYAGGAFPSGAAEGQIVTSPGTYSPTIIVGSSASGKAVSLAVKSS